MPTQTPFFLLLLRQPKAAQCGIFNCKINSLLHQHNTEYGSWSTKKLQELSHVQQAMFMLCTTLQDDARTGWRSGRAAILDGTLAAPSRPRDQCTKPQGRLTTERATADAAAQHDGATLPFQAYSSQWTMALNSRHPGSQHSTLSRAVVRRRIMFTSPRDNYLLSLIGQW